MEDDYPEAFYRRYRRWELNREPDKQFSVDEEGMVTEIVVVKPHVTQPPPEPLDWRRWVDPT
jgi:hypothetical protein